MKKDSKKETNNQFFPFKEADSANDKMLPASKQKENNYEQRNLFGGIIFFLNDCLKPKLETAFKKKTFKHMSSEPTLLD